MADTFPRVATAEVATPQSDPRFSYGGRVLSPTDEVLTRQTRQKGLASYRDLRRDAKVAAVLDKRSAMVTSAEWEVVPGKRRGMEPTKEYVYAADLVRHQVDTLGARFDLAARGEFAAAHLAAGFDRVCYGLLEAHLLGLGVGEVLWQRDGREVVATEVRIREAERFRFDTEHRLRLITRANRTDGELLSPRKFLPYTWGSLTDPYGRGLGHQLFWPVFFKRQDLAFFMRYLDKFGGPTVKGSYKAGTDPNSLPVTQLLLAAASVQTNAAVVVPDDQDLTILAGAASAAQAGYENLLAYLDNQIALAALGVTLTTELQGQGSRAATETHQDDQQQLGRNDADHLSGFLNTTLLPWVTAYNVDGAVPPQLWRVFPEPEDLKGESDVLVSLNGIGFRPTLEHVNSRFGGGGDVFVDVQAERDAKAAAIAAGQGSGPAAGDQDPPPGLTPDELKAYAREAQNAEFAEGGREYSSTQLGVTGDVARAVVAMGAAIPDADLHPNGREDEPHVTVKFGLTDATADGVARAVAGFGPVTVTLGATTLFQNPEFDVVKVAVEGARLRELNALVASSCACVDTHPEYVPHLTVAYVLPGLGVKYEGDQTLKGRRVTFDSLLFSGKDGERRRISLLAPADLAAPRSGESLADWYRRRAEYAEGHPMDAPDALADGMLDKAAAGVSKMREALKRTVGASGSLAEALVAVAESYADLGPDEIEDALAEAMEAAGHAGRIELDTDDAPG